MKVAIMGSPRRLDTKITVDSIIKGLHMMHDTDLEIVTGGCQGTEIWADVRACMLKIKSTIMKPDLKGTRSIQDILNKYYDRDKRMARYCDAIYVFTPYKRGGGYDHLIRQFGLMNREITIMEAPKSKF